MADDIKLSGRADDKLVNGIHTGLNVILVLFNFCLCASCVPLFDLEGSNRMLCFFFAFLVIGSFNIAMIRTGVLFSDFDKA